MLGSPVKEDVMRTSGTIAASSVAASASRPHETVHRAGSGEEPDHRIRRRITSQGPPGMLDSFDNIVWTVLLAELKRSTGGEAGGAKPVGAESIRWNVRNDHDS